MASSVIISVPSSPSSSYQTAENEGECRDSLEVETELSDLNQRCHVLEHEVSRLIFENVDNNEKLMSLKRRIEVFNQGENQLNREIEQLERKFLNLMLEKGLKDDKLEFEKFGEEKETEGCEVLKEKKLEQVLDLMLDIGKNNDKFKDLSIGIDESKKCEESEVFHGLGSDPGRQPVNPSELVSDKKELGEKFEKMGVGDVFDKVEWNDSDIENEIRKANIGDDGEDEEDIGLLGVRELCKEIELLEAMLEKGSFGLLDLKLMMEEVEALKGPEKMMSEMEVKMAEMETGLWELKNAIVELKDKKSKELKAWFIKEEENESECGGHEKANARKLTWGSIVTIVGAVAVAAAALIFMGRTRVNVAAEKRNKHKSG